MTRKLTMTVELRGAALAMTGRVMDLRGYTSSPENPMRGDLMGWSLSLPRLSHKLLRIGCLQSYRCPLRSFAPGN